MELVTRLGKGGKRRGPQIAQINITPVVDVMLVLLIIFMITSPMLVAGINVDLPESSASQVSGQDEPLSITIDKNRNIYIMDTKIHENELIEKIKAILNEKYSARIFVRGDKSLPYGKVIELISKINSAGFTKVALITNTKDNEK
ncbi:MAG: protein TolR [Rickettsiaceae bacterium]|nr:protein TolR [Rickettsiaceae bacterium]